ncbi:MAG: ybbC [Parachlamydiales bacterium]|nr:ybbC [Parachlamydiales bacterium]
MRLSFFVGQAGAAGAGGRRRFFSGTSLRAIQLFLEHAPVLELAALFSPEHGLQGQQWAEEKVKNHKSGPLPIYSLHGETRRPSVEMLKDVDVLIYDIQCVGSRAYTYPTTLFYAMEEAAKLGKEVVVFDRPNPINGLTIDGPMLEERWRSFIGYVNVPYCHGMTIGELALFFNGEYKIGCKLKVISMRGWKRSMSYRDTGLAWIPPSPNIPEADTPFFYPSTGMISGLKLLNIGVGYTLPFKIVGAPWIDAKKYAQKLNEQKLAGVHFLPFYFKPFYGLYKSEDCQGVLIQMTDSLRYRPIAVQYVILGVLKSMYPKEFAQRLNKAGSMQLFHQANGTEAVFQILTEEKYATWKLLEFQQEERKAFSVLRQKYLLPDYPMN